MYRVALFFILFITVASAERSVYDTAGGYSTAKKNHQSILALNQEIAQLRQEIEGLRSVVEGLSQSLGEIRQKEANSGDSDNSKLLESLGTMIDKINRNYVSKVELSKALKSGKVASNKIKVVEKKENSGKQKPKTNSKLENAKSSDLYSRGVRLVKKKKYSMAILRFNILKKRNYKKASTYFYLGEIAYRTKKYSDAIEYYKVSASANESANYMDTLLLHTALSLEKVGQKTQAKRFFQAIVDGYPDTGSAKVAKRHL